MDALTWVLGAIVDLALAPETRAVLAADARVGGELKRVAGAGPGPKHRALAEKALARLEGRDAERTDLERAAARNLAALAGPDGSVELRSSAFVRRDKDGKFTSFSEYSIGGPQGVKFAVPMMRHDTEEDAVSLLSSLKAMGQNVDEVIRDE